MKAARLQPERRAGGRRRLIAALGSAAALMAVAGIGMRFRADLRTAVRRLKNASSVIATPFGVLEYGERGRGTPILMIHGTGGGFDQGLDMANPLISRGFRVIAPSRFGYLRSDFPCEPSSENQADALVWLLDQLKIDRIAVAGGSAGALSAVQFALRHPDRCSALILLVPAANVSGADPVEMTPAQKFLVQRILGSDFLFWAVRRIVPDELIRHLLATDPQLLASVDPTERTRAYRILDNLMPVSCRARGLLNDARLAGATHRVDYSRIAMPTLILSANDDRFGTAATSLYLASAIPNASLVVLPSGGHVWLGWNEVVFDRMARFLRTDSLGTDEEKTRNAAGQGTIAARPSSGSAS